MADREPIKWITVNGKHVPIYEDENSKIDKNVASKFSKKAQSKITFAEKDRSGKYHIVVEDEKYGEASFHDTNFGNLKWELTQFLKDGSKF